MLAVLLFAAQVASGAPDVAGLWRTPERNGLVEVSHCGAELCGKLISSEGLKKDPNLKDEHNRDPSQRLRPLKGLELFQGVTGSGGVWRGKIYNPKDGGTYSATVEPQGADKLKVSGCVVQPLCKTEIWQRAPADAATH
jgi:uncharacterized protein (DUF2147 family)